MNNYHAQLFWYNRPPKRLNYGAIITCMHHENYADILAESKVRLNSQVMLLVNVGDYHLNKRNDCMGTK